MFDRTLFVAEVSSNHNKDLNRCLRFIDTAVNIGCDAVKFQLFKIDKLFAPEVLAKSEEHNRRRHWELPLEFLPSISDHCKKMGIDFGCTPFYLKAVEELLPYVCFYKIASYELLWDDLLIKCARTGKPMVLSTGMATMEEIAHAVNVLRGNGCEDLTLLHCVSSYPVPSEECNLAVIETIRRRFRCRVGWSDHSSSPAVIYRAVHRWAASFVEFHLDIDGEGEEFSFGHCWLPDDIRVVIQHVKEGFDADGSGIKEPALSELADRDWRRDPSDGLRPLISIRLRGKY